MRLTLPESRIPLAKRFVAPILLYVMLQLADATTTALAISRGAIEANVFLGFLMAHGGFPALFAIKIIGSCVIGTTSYLMLANYGFKESANRVAAFFHKHFASIDLWSYHFSNLLQALVVVWNIHNLTILHNFDNGGGT
jgi:hypothetical protein